MTRSGPQHGVLGWAGNAANIVGGIVGVPLVGTALQLLNKIVEITLNAKANKRHCGVLREQACRYYQTIQGAFADHDGTNLPWNVHNNISMFINTLNFIIPSVERLANKNILSRVVNSGTHETELHSLQRMLLDAYNNLQLGNILSNTAQLGRIENQLENLPEAMARRLQNNYQGAQYEVPPHKDQFASGPLACAPTLDHSDHFNRIENQIARIPEAVALHLNHNNAQSSPPPYSPNEQQHWKPTRNPIVKGFRFTKNVFAIVKECGSVLTRAPTHMVVPAVRNLRVGDGGRGQGFQSVAYY